MKVKLYRFAKVCCIGWGISAVGIMLEFIKILPDGESLTSFGLTVACFALSLSLFKITKTIKVKNVKERAVVWGTFLSIPICIAIFTIVHLYINSWISVIVFNIFACAFASTVGFLAGLTETIVEQRGNNSRKEKNE